MSALTIGVAATVVCAGATAALVYAELFSRELLRTLSKFVASGSFIVVGATRCDGSTFATCIIAGLVLGAIGDIALLGRSNRAFLAGLVAFLFGHMAYVVAAGVVAPLASWVQLLAIIPIVAAAIALRWLWPTLGSFRIPVIVYVAAITAMVIGAFAVGRTCFTIGAISFFASDVFVAREKFVTQDFANKLYGLPAYFAGQLLIAWSI